MKIGIYKKNFEIINGLLMNLVMNQHVGSNVCIILFVGAVQCM